jgi:hypothetical protein
MLHTGAMFGCALTKPTANPLRSDDVGGDLLSTASSNFSQMPVTIPDAPDSVSSLAPSNILSKRLSN